MRTTRKPLALLLAVAMVFTMTAMTALATGGDDDLTTPDGGAPTTPNGGTPTTPDGGDLTTPDDPTTPGDPATPEVSAEAKAVIALIEALPTSEEIQEAMTADTFDVEAYKAQVSAARAAYDKLTEEQKAEVTNIANLTQAEETLALLELISPLGDEEVCEIKDGKSYTTLEDAVEAVQPGDTIKLLANITLSDKTSLQIKDKGASGSPVTLDFNSFTVTGNAEGIGNIVNDTNGIIALQNSFMTFTDSSSGTKGGIINSSTASKNTCVLLVGTDSSVTIEGGINLIQSSTGSSSHVLRTKDATTKIDNGVLDGKGYIITCHGTGGVTINGGKYSSKKTETVSCFNINSGASVTINGGTFTNWSNLDMAKVGEGKYICCDDTEVTVQSEEPEPYLASIGNFYLQEGDLYDLIARTFPASGDIPDSINIIGEVTCTYPGGKYFGISYGAAKTLTITINETGKLSGTMPLRVADVTVTGTGAIEDDFFVADNEGDADTYEVITTTVSDGKLHSGRIKDEAVAAWVTWGGNTYSYNDVAAAIKAANQNAGSVLKLNQDSTSTTYTAISKSWTLDLNGHTYNYTRTSYPFYISTSNVCFTLTDSSESGNGKLVVNEKAKAAIATTSNATNCKIVIEKGVTIQGNTILIEGTNNTLDVSGTIATGNKNIAIQTNGSSTKNSTITLHGGAEVTSKSCAIYHPGTGTLNVHKATVTGGEGFTGIEMRAGTLNVYDGAEITGGNGKPDSNSNDNGTTTNNAAIAVAQHNTGEAININIKGGTFTGGAAFYESNPQKNSTDIAKVTIQIKGGTFTATDPNADSVYSENKTGFITGGKFSSDVKEYVADQHDQLVTNKETTPFWVDQYSDRGAADAVGQTVYKVTYQFENESVDVYYMTEAEAEEAIKEAEGDNVVTKEPVAAKPTPSGGGGSGSYRPVILSPSWSQTVSVVEHGTLTMSVRASRASSYQWFVDRGDGRDFVAIAGATGPSLTIWPDMGDNGNRYYCRAMNGYGGVDSPYFTLCVVRSTLPPKTGDQVSVTLWVCLMALGVAGVLAAWNRQRNR